MTAAVEEMEVQAGEDTIEKKMPEMKSIDQRDASTLAALAFAFRKYGAVPELKSLAKTLKTPNGQAIAKAILGTRKKPDELMDVAQVYLTWADENLIKKVSTK